MLDIKKLIVVGLATIGSIVVFSLIQKYAPLWVWITICIIGLVAFLLSCSYEPKPRPKKRYWIFSCEYVKEGDERIWRSFTLKSGIEGNPFLEDSEISNIDKWIRFSCIEVTEETAKRLSKKIDELKESGNR